MDAYSLRQHPDPVLRATATPVRSFDDDLVDLARALLGLMRKHDGAGLAAPQIGVSRRVLTLRGLVGEGDRVLVNPEWMARSREVTIRPEGCLSLPGIVVPVPRSRRVRVRYRTLTGARRTVDLAGLAARVCQHEMDHLSGRLIIDYRDDRPSPVP